VKLSDALEAEAQKCEDRVKRCEAAGHVFTHCAREHNTAVVNVWRAAAKIAREANQ